MKVVKRSGEIEEFDSAKTRRAILRVGVTEEEADYLIGQLGSRLYDGITTEEIYRQVKALLDKRSSVRFGLKKAILAMGPEGNNFETLVGRLFESMGYLTKVRQTVQGRCVSHEIDVLMEEDSKRYMAECKFHNSLSMKCSIQTALYTYGRFLDVDAANDLQCPYLVTNTRFTSEVEKYAKCVGMRLIGWRYPENGSLEELLETYRLYPLTILDIHKAEVASLLANDILLVSDIVKRQDVVMRLLGNESGSRTVRMAESFLK